MTTGEILRAAAARVRQGWCRYLLHSGDSVCALGALNVAESRPACSSHVFISEAAAVIARALHLPQDLEVHDSHRASASVAAWNNAKDQTTENVAAGLEYAALVWEESQALAACSDAPRTVAGGVRG